MFSKLQYTSPIQRIRFNFDQKFTIFSQIMVLMIQYSLSFYLSFIIFTLLGSSSLSADNPTLLFTDSIPPSPTLNAGSLNVGGPFTVGVGFSENVYGLTMDDFSVENGEVIEVTGSEMNYFVLIDPLAVGIVRFKVPAGVVVDEAGNENTPSGTLTVNFTDEEEPEVELSTPQTSVSDIFPVNVEFNEPVTGLEISDFNISNGAGVDLTGSEMSYILNVNPGAIGAVSIFLPSEAVIDTAGNPNLVSNFLQVNFGPLDTTAPEVELTTASTQVSEPFFVEVRFTEEITGLELSDFSVTNANLSDLGGNGNVFTVLATPILEGEIRISLDAETIVDLFDNPNDVSNELVVNYIMPLAPDTIRPIIILADVPTGVEGVYGVTIQFSEEVNELLMTDLILENGVLTSFMENGSIYYAEIDAIDFGTVTFSIPENVVTDLSGNGNIANSITWDFEDNTPPVVDPEPILDITLNRVNEVVEIDWVTNTESTNAFFEIWYSSDGINFEQLDEITSIENTTGVFSYNYKHVTPKFGLNYYFVRQFDQNDDSVDSETAIIDYLNLFPEALIYPSPATNIVTFNTTEYAGLRCEIMIYNTLGQIFLLDIYEALPSSPIEVDISDFQAGVYGVQFWIKETANIESSFLIMR